MSKSDFFENAFLQLILHGVTIANIADNAAASPAANLSIALHTADPGEGGDQSTNEATYTGYARENVVRSASGFDIVANVGSLANDVLFGSPSAGTETLTHFSIGTGVGDTMLWSGSLSPVVGIVPGGQPPNLTTGTTITED